MLEENKTVELKEEELEKVSGGTVDTSNAKYTDGNLFHKNDGTYDIYVKIHGLGTCYSKINYKDSMIKIKISDGSIIRAFGSINESELDTYTLITSLPSNVNFD